MFTFADVYTDHATGQLTMFDRIVFKGHLSGFFPLKRFELFLYQQGVLLKEFSSYAEKTTGQLKTHLKAMAEEAGCPFRYLSGGRGNEGEDKLALAQQIATESGVTTGLVAILGALEMNNSFTVQGNRQTHQIDVVSRQRKHLHYYLYYLDPEFGFMYVRIQSWWPFQIQIYINGREWLAKQMDQQDITYNRYENCFLEISDLQATQKLCDKFAHRKWERVWNAFAQRVNPFLEDIESYLKKGYYWCVNQCEIATDVMFTEQKDLDTMLPDLFQEALLLFSAQDIMRFLGRKLRGNFLGEVRTHINKRHPGWRVKHWVKQNSLKMYNKGSVLRVETTVNNSSEFHIPAPESNSRRWKPLPKGVSYFWHYYQAGSQANQRYLDALQQVNLQGEAALEALNSLCQSQQEEGRRIAKFNPVTEADCSLFGAVLSGDHILTGFRNRHICVALYDIPTMDEREKRRRCARVSRLIAKLRGHKLVERVAGSHLYRVTDYGYQVMSAALHYRFVDFPFNFAPT